MKILLILTFCFLSFAKNGKDLNQRLKIAEFEKMQAELDKKNAESRKSLLEKHEQFIKDIEKKTTEKRERAFQEFEKNKEKENKIFDEKKKNAELSFEKDKEYALKTKKVQFLIDAVSRRDKIIDTASNLKEQYMKKHEKALKEEIENLTKQEKLALKQMKASKFTKEELNEMIKAETSKLQEAEMKRIELLEKKK